ncbi:MAG: ABC transporter permease [Candidatus Micrarchaeota archaeon]
MSSTLRGLLALFRREILGVNRNVLLLLLILILPLAFGFMFGTFKNIVPRNAPSIVIPSNDNLTQDDMRFANAALSLFSAPTVVSANTPMDLLFNKLYREEAYFIVSVPHDIFNSGEPVRVYVDASMSPVSELSPYVREMILYELYDWRKYGVDIEINEVGTPALPFQFFVPGVLVLLMVAVGLLVVPFTTSKDSAVFGRVLRSTSPALVAVSKLGFALVLAAIQVVVLILTQKFAGASESSLISMNAWTLYVLLCTAVSFTSLGLIVLLLTKFQEIGKQINAALFGAVVVFSGIFFPVGFFPSLPILPTFFQTVARFFPTYYSVILTRGFGVRGLAHQIMGDYLAIITVVAVVLLAVLHYSLWRFRKNG